MPDLKPCPFCGGKAEVHDLGGLGYFVKCRKCSINQDKLYKQRCYAVKAWNKRVKDERIVSDERKQTKDT